MRLAFVASYSTTSGPPEPMMGESRVIISASRTHATHRVSSAAKLSCRPPHPVATEHPRAPLTQSRSFAHRRPAFHADVRSRGVRRLRTGERDPLPAGIERPAHTLDGRDGLVRPRRIATNRAVFADVLPTSRDAHTV